MNEQELRALVRTAVAQHLGTAAPPIAVPDARAASTLSSHTLYADLVNVGDACVIEPAVKCDHCGYCKSHGY